MAETKYYTLAEVAKHKTNNDVWMVVHNNVYNVTEFLNEVSPFFVHTIIWSILHGVSVQ